MRNLLKQLRQMHQNPSPRRKYCPEISENDSVVIGNYILSFEADYFYKDLRYHWMICATVNPEEMVCWGHAPTLRLAELAARSEVAKLEFALVEASL